MLISEEWLRSFIDPPESAAALAERLTMAGLEVESVEAVAPPCTKVVVAAVLGVAPHPGADRLRVCEVDAGTGGRLTIVCGAPNVAPGLRVPCALPGAQLPGGVAIRATTMRGVESQGMLCSARELGLGDDHSGLLVLDGAAPIGRDVREVLGLDDQRLEIKLTPNRGDCLGVLGIAREVAALTGAPLRLPAFDPVAVDDAALRLKVTVHASDLCGRFSGRVVRGVDARAPTPDWMKRRLERCGQRPISALVDISNYVMLELGRPTHVFDLDKVSGALDVRWGRAGEQVELLNGQTVTVDETVGVIADARGVEGLAGVMGGAATAVSLDTANVYLEAAFWWPEAIQGRSRRYNFATEAAHRFERGVDFATTAAHLEHLTRLIVSICGTPRTRVGPLDDQTLRLPVRAPVAMRLARCRKLIGIEVGADEVAGVFDRLGFAYRREDGEGESGARFVVTPPPQRFDIAIEEDLVEEIARIWGFERIPALPPLAPAKMRAEPETRRSAHAVRHALVAAGYQELVNYSFVDPQIESDIGVADPIRVLNPIAAQRSVMRSNLIGGLLEALRYNLNQRAARVRVFEVGRVFRRAPESPDGPLAVAGVDQPLRVAALAYGPVEAEQWGSVVTEVDFFDLKGDLERLLAPHAAVFVGAANPAFHPGRCAAVELGGQRIGWIGELHPRWQQKFALPRAAQLFEVDLDALLDHALPHAAAIVRQPEVVRDIALWVDAQLPAAQVVAVVDAMRRHDTRLSVVREFRLFDLFRPSSEASGESAVAGANALLNKEKSLAFRIVLQDTQRTLSDADADVVREAIAAELESRLGARLRR